MRNIYSLVLISMVIYFCPLYSFTGEKPIIMSEQQIADIPSKVIPYADGNKIILKNFTYKDGNATVEFESKGQKNFVLLFYFAKGMEILIVSANSEFENTLHSSGNATFGFGYKIDGNDKKGKIKFSIPQGITGFEFIGLKGKAYLFATKQDFFSKKNPPQGQDKKEFHSISNVITIDFQF